MTKSIDQTWLAQLGSCNGCLATARPRRRLRRRNRKIPLLYTVGTLSCGSPHSPLVAATHEVVGSQSVYVPPPAPLGVLEVVRHCVASWSDSSGPIAITPPDNRPVVARFAVWSCITAIALRLSRGVSIFLTGRPSVHRYPASNRPAGRLSFWFSASSCFRRRISSVSIPRYFLRQV